MNVLELYLTIQLVNIAFPVAVGLAIGRLMFGKKTWDKAWSDLLSHQSTDDT